MPKRETRAGIAAAAGVGISWILAVVGVGVSALIAAALIRTSVDSSDATATPQLVPVTTHRGFEQSPSISPDGSHVAFVWNGETQDNPDIYVTGLPTGPTVRLTTTNPQREDQPVWSPDGNEIAFLRWADPRVAQVVVVPWMGGAERVIAENVQQGTLDWSHDGRWLIYSAARDGEPAGLWVQSKDSGERHHLAGTTEGDRAAQFSPNDRSVAFNRIDLRAALSDVHVVSLDGQMRAAGEPRRLTSDGRTHRSPRWISDSELVFTTGAFGTGSIDRMSISGGRLRRVITVDGIGGGIDVSPATGRLLVTQDRRDIDIYLVELSAEGTAGHLAGPLIASPGKDVFPVYSPNGERVGFASTRSGDWQIWSSDRDGSNAIQLTNLRNAEVRPVAWKPPSGEQLGFLHNGDGNGMRAYMVDASGGATRPVPELENVTTAIGSFWWSPDGSGIFYSTQEGVWKVATGGGTPVKLSVQNFFPASEGPSFGGYDSTSGGWHLMSLDGSPESSIALPSMTFSPLSGEPILVSGREPLLVGVFGAWMGLRVSAYGPRGVYAWLFDFRPQWTYARSLASRTQLTFFPLDRRNRLPIVEDMTAPLGASLSPNGRKLLYCHTVTSGADLVLLNNFK